jgi:hypothetical protein
MCLIDEQKYNSKSFRNFQFISQNGLNKYRFLHEFHRILTRSKSKTQKIEMKLENGKEGKERQGKERKGKEKEKENTKGTEIKTNKERNTSELKYFSMSKYKSHQ